MWILPISIIFYAYLWVKSSLANSMNSFDDSIIFKFTWNDMINEKELLNDPQSDYLLMTTQDKDKYLCYLPNEIKTDRSNIKEYKGPTGFELLKPLFFQTKCSYKQDQYWTYELCHGRHLRQYHEESSFQGSQVQEFLLGRFDPSTIGPNEKEMRVNQKIPTVKVGDVDLPYLEVNMTFGTMCDLGSKTPRLSKIRYVCSNEDIRHDFYSIKESSTCEYEAIFLTPFLCLHPHYAVKIFPQNDIQCHAIGGSPIKPKEVGREVPEYPEDDEEYEEPFIAEFPSEEISPPPPPPLPPRGEEIGKPPHDPKLIEDFLSGTYCLQGGTGWWKYEFCFGRKIEQFHEDSNSKMRQTILLGMWNKKDHVTWIQKNPNKKPKNGAIKQVSHYYGSGSFCEATQKKRFVEVKLKCKESAKRMDAVSIYLSEPKTCEYVLSVESGFICPILENVSGDGTFNSKLF